MKHVSGAAAYNVEKLSTVLVTKLQDLPPEPLI